MDKVKYDIPKFQYLMMNLLNNELEAGKIQI
jgi:hypothetical protein